MKRLKLIAGFICSFGSALFCALAWFSPTKFETFQLGFVMFLANRLWPEFLLLLAAGILLLLPIRLWKVAGQFLQKAFIQPYRQMGAVGILPILLSLPLWFCVGLAWISAATSLYGAARTRLIYHRHFLIKEYRHSIVRKALMYERYAQLTDAVSTCDEILKRWDSEEWSEANASVEGKKTYLLALIKYSRDCFAEVTHEQSNVPDRSRWSALIKANAIFPEQAKTKKLFEWHEKLVQAHPVPRQFMEAIRKGNASAARELYEKWSWYLFDDAVRPAFDAYLKNGKLFERLRLFAANISDVDFQLTTERSWEMEKARSVIVGCNKVQKMTANGEFFDEVEADDDPVLLSGRDIEVSTEEITPTLRLDPQSEAPTEPESEATPEPDLAPL